MICKWLTHSKTSDFAFFGFSVVKASEENVVKAAKKATAVANTAAAAAVKKTPAPPAPAPAPAPALAPAPAPAPAATKTPAKKAASNATPALKGDPTPQIKNLFDRHVTRKNFGRA